MSIRMLGIIALIVIVFAVAVLLIPHQFRKMISIILAVLLFVFIVILCLYMLNPPFKQFVNINFNKTSQHTYILSNQQYGIPLPASTTINYRFSETGASYITKSDLSEIISFYSNIASPNSFSNIADNKITHLSFLYEEREFKITIEQVEGKKNHYLTVDLRNDQR